MAPSRSASPGARRLRPGVMALMAGLGLLRGIPAEAQEGIVGRWRIDVYDITPAPLYGELIFSDSAGATGGRAEFSNRSGPPVALSQVRVGDTGLLEFVVPGDGGAVFSGRAVDGFRMRGDVVADGGRRGRWTAERLDPSIEFYPVLPRFRLRQLVGGVGGDRAVLPGALVAAATKELPRAGLTASYERIARASGLAPLSGAQLQSEGPGRVLGFNQRVEVLAAVQHMLEQLRATLPTDAERAQFDALFRPGGGWRLDLHGAALEIARLRSRRLQWDDVVPALIATGSIGDSTAAAAAVPRAMERLLMLRSADSTALGRMLATAAATVPVSARSLGILLSAYPEAEDWHHQAVAFLLRARWINQDGALRSPGDVVRATWLAIMPGDSARVRSTPAIASRLFGQPQAVPRYGVSSASTARLVTPLNWSGERWIDRHGAAGTLAMLHLLDLPGSGELLVARGDETLRVVSVKQRAAESTSGFLEEREAIAVEPSYIPVLALGAVLHEWGHLLAEGWRFDQAVVAATDSGEVALPGINPWLVEGIAEAWTDLVLGPIMPRLPLVGLAELEKRVRLSGAELDPHVTGYLVARAAIGAAASQGTAAPVAIGRLIEAGEPARVLLDPLFAATFRDPGDVGPLIIPAPSRRFLVPESIFSVDTSFPDPVSTIIRMPE